MEWYAPADTPACPGRSNISSLFVGLAGVFLDGLVAYDASADTWATLTPMKAPRGDKAVAVLDGQLVVVGGETWSGKKAPCAWDTSVSCDINQVPIHVCQRE